MAKRVQDFDIGYVLVCCVLGLASLNSHGWASIIGVVECYLAHLEWGPTFWRIVEAFYSSSTLSPGYLATWKPWSQADTAVILTLTNSPPLHQFSTTSASCFFEACESILGKYHTLHSIIVLGMLTSLITFRILTVAPEIDQKLQLGSRIKVIQLSTRLQ